MRFLLRLVLLFWPLTFRCTRVPAQSITGDVTADDGTFIIAKPSLPAKLVISQLN